VSIIRGDTDSGFKTDIFTLKRRTNGRLIRLLLWMLIPFVLWWSLRNVPLAEVFNNLRLLGLEAILILIGLNLLIFAMFSLRWWLVLRVQGYQLSFFSLIRYRLAGFGVTYFTPGPQFGGEPLQVYLLKQREQIATSAAAASVAVDKLLELLANFSFLLVGVSALVFGGFLVGKISPGLIVFPFLLLVVPVVYLIALWNNQYLISILVCKLEDRFPNHSRIRRIRKTLVETESQVSRFFRENTLGFIAAAALSVGVWIFMVIEFSLMLNFLGAHLTLAQVLIALTAARIAFLLPLPAGLGTLEAGQVMAMGLIGVSPVIGISLTLLIRLRDVIFGGIGLWLGGIYSK
jgi:uncharacterized protein (TIRG00374 family)